MTATLGRCETIDIHQMIYSQKHSISYKLAVTSRHGKSKNKLNNLFNTEILSFISIFVSSWQINNFTLTDNYNTLLLGIRDQCANTLYFHIQIMTIFTKQYFVDLYKYHFFYLRNNQTTKQNKTHFDNWWY